MRIAMFSAAAGLAVAATPVVAQTISSASYVMKAGAGDLYERESSRIVLQTTANSGLKRFAQMMARDHSKSTAEVKKAALMAGVHPKPPKLTPEQASNIAALRASSGADRDILYVSQQKMAHQDALALHQAEAASGRSKPLPMVASKIVPVVQHHIAMLNTM